MSVIYNLTLQDLHILYIDMHVPTLQGLHILYIDRHVPTLQDLHILYIDRHVPNGINTAHCKPRI